jgi:hypothetical protein
LIVRFRMTKNMVLALVVTAIIVAALVLLRWRTHGVSNLSPDASVLWQLRKAGSDLRKSHNIEFFMYFPSEAAAQRVARSLVTNGFVVRVNPAAGGEQEWVALATRTMVPELAKLEQIRALLTTISESESGDYDGWGTPVIK